MTNRNCGWCDTPLTGRTKRARFCRGVSCRRKYVKRERRIATYLLRPNCLVCGTRLKYDPHRRLSARTCSAKCSKKAWLWFGPMKPRKIAA